MTNKRSTGYFAKYNRREVELKKIKSASKSASYESLKLATKIRDQAFDEVLNENCN
jgi:hypothetical protein